MRLTGRGVTAFVLSLLGLVLTIDAIRQVGVGGVAVTLTLVFAGVGAVAAGMFSTVHRPDSAFGLLLQAAGCLWFVSEWNSPTAGSAVMFTVGLSCWAAFPIVAAHAAFAFPSGRIGTRVERILIAAGYGVFVGLLGLLPALLLEPAALGCRACPTNLILVTSEPMVVDRLAGPVDVCAMLVAAGLAAAGVVRLVRSTPTARRMTLPVLAPCVVLLIAGGVVFLRAAEPGVVPQDHVSRMLWTVQAVALLAMSAGVVLDWLRLRRARSRMAGFVIALGDTGGDDDIKDVLSTALHDPTLDVAYPLTDGRLVTSHGEPASPNDRQATTALVRGGHTVALISHQRDLLGDPALLAAVVAATRLPLDNERLSAEARAQLAELGASQLRIIELGESERRRLERDLHDGAQQRLLALMLGLRHAGSTARTPKDAAAFDHAADELMRVIEDLRRLASGIYPAVLTDTGLLGALTALAEESDHPVQIIEFPQRRLPPVVETTAYQLLAAICPCGPVRVRAALADTVLAINIDADALPADLRARG